MAALARALGSGVFDDAHTQRRAKKAGLGSLCLPCCPIHGSSLSLIAAHPALFVSLALFTLASHVWAGPRNMWTFLRLTHSLPTMPPPAAPPRQGRPASSSLLLALLLLATTAVPAAAQGAFAQPTADANTDPFATAAADNSVSPGAPKEGQGFGLAPSQEPRLRFQGIATVAYDRQPLTPFGAANLGCGLGFVSPDFQVP